MNDGGMKQGRRFMALWHIEYVWLSAVWWKRLDVSDGHAERNLLNDSIPPEKLQKGFIFVYLIRGPAQTFVGRRWMGKAVAQIYKASENKIKVIHVALCNSGRVIARLTRLTVFNVSDTGRRGTSLQLGCFLFALTSDFVSAHLGQRYTRQKTRWVSSPAHVRLRAGATVIVRVKRCSLSSVIR